MKDDHPINGMVAIANFAVKLANNSQVSNDKFQKIAKLTCYQRYNPWHMVTFNIAVAGHINTPSQLDVETELIRPLQCANFINSRLWCVKLLRYIQSLLIHLWVSAILPHKHVLAPSLMRNIVRK